MFEKIVYGDLNGRQQETYNFQKVAGELADYGYACLLLNDDWQGADFLAVHIDGETLLRVQLKSRFGLHKTYRGKGLHIAFRTNGEEYAETYVYPHDKVLDVVFASGRVSETESWREKGSYHWPVLPKWARDILEPYKI